MALGFFEAVDPIEQAKNPNYVASRRRMLEALQKEAMSTAPIKHWTQGGARLLNALANKYEEGQLAKGEREGLKENAAILASLFGGTGTAPGVSPAGAAVAPGGGPPPSPGAPARPAEVVVPDPTTSVTGAPVRGVQLPPEIANAQPQNVSASPYGELQKSLPGDVAAFQPPPGAGAQMPQQVASASPSAMYQPRPSDPRGIRNNNPGNIEDGAFARSLPGYAGTDGRFAKFETPAQGIAAQSKLMDVYSRKHGINSIAGIVNRYAPASDNNNVMAYASSVAKAVGVGPNDPINISDPSVKAKLLPAMIRQENGRMPYQPQTIAAGVGGQPVPGAQADAFGASVIPGSPAIPPSPGRPYNVAQAGGAPVAPPQSNVQQRLMAAMGNPNFAAYIQKNPIALMMLQQQIGKDPITRQKQLLEIEMMRQNIQGGTPQQRELAALQAQELRKKINSDDGTWNIEKDRNGNPAFMFNNKTAQYRPITADGTLGPPKDADVTGLRKEITQLPSYKNMAQVAPIYRGMSEAVTRNSKAADINLVYGLAKIFDPTSVVREGEYATVAKSATIPEYVKGWAQMLQGGGRLTPETRRQIMEEAYGRIGSYQTQFKSDAEMYNGIVQRRKMNPADVIPNFGEFKPHTSVTMKKSGNAPQPTGQTGAGKVGVYNPATGKIEYQ